MTWSGALSDVDPRMNRLRDACTNVETRFDSPYEVRTVTNRTLSTYALRLASNQQTYQPSGDPWGGLELRNSISWVGVYIPTFAPGSPTASCVTSRYATNATVDFSLAPGQTAHLVIASGGAYDVPVWSMTLSER